MQSNIIRVKDLNYFLCDFWIAACMLARRIRNCSSRCDYASQLFGVALSLKASLQNVPKINQPILLTTCWMIFTTTSLARVGEIELIRLIVRNYGNNSCLVVVAIISLSVR